MWKVLSPWVEGAVEQQSALALVGSVEASPFIEEVSGEQQEYFTSYRARYEHPRARHIKETLNGLLTSSVFLLASMSFSLLLCFMILFRVDGAVGATVILPLLALLLFFSSPWEEEGRDVLYPTETVLIKDYLREEPELSLTKQHEQLGRAWETYLATSWGEKEGITFSDKVERGKFYFHVAQLKEGGQEKMPAVFPPFVPLLFFFLWNVLFFVLMMYFR